MKKSSIAVLFVFCVLFVSSLHAFYREFYEEPFVNLMAPSTLGNNKPEFNLQHNFNEGRIASANIRFGYGVTESLDVYATLLTHASEILSGSNAADLSINEYEVLLKHSLMSEQDGKKLSVSVLFGGSNYNFSQTFLASKFEAQETYGLLQLLVSKNVKNILLLNVSPIWIYEHVAKESIFGISMGAKLNCTKKVALVFEVPVLISNPHDWKPPFSAGLQFKMGPHFLTLFATNTYGMTVSNVMQGLDRNFYGFRFSF